MKISRIKCFCAIVCCLSLLMFSSCKKSDDDDDTPTTTDTGTGTGGGGTGDEATTGDMSDEDFGSTLREIIPVGALSLSLTRSTAEPEGTPCNDMYATDDGYNQPEQNSFECKIALLFADPDIYGNVGQEGVLESLIIVNDVFKRSATNTCANPLTGDDQDIAGPILAGTRKYSCGHLITTEEMTANLIAGGVMGDMPEAEIAEQAATIKTFIYWGETGATGAKVKNFVAIDDMGGDKNEKGVWRFQKNQAATEFTVEATNVHGQSPLYQSMFKFGGNYETHEFTVNLRRGDVENSTYDLLIKGMGVSQGAGEYYLLKLMCSTCTWEGAVYGDSELSVCMSAETQTIAAAANCEKYETDLDAMDYYEKTDLPDAFDDVVVPTAL